MEAIILAGGMGTRLREVVKDVPKPMAPIKDKPFLAHLLKWASNYAISRFIFSVGYKAEVIQGYFGDKFNGVPIVYAHENEPLGTGGAVLNALSFTTGEDILIVNGDTYFPINLDDFLSFHHTNQGKISIALKRMTSFERYGTVELVDTDITGFKEKKYLDEGLINGGIYLVQKSFFKALNLPEKFSFEKEVMEKEAGSGNLKGMVFTETFIDIGVPADYYKACEEL